MTYLVAAAFGFALGLVFFATLWFSVRRLVYMPRLQLLIGIGGLVRLFLAGLALYALSRQGPGKLLAGLAGLWMARWVFIGRVGAPRHAR